MTGVSFEAELDLSDAQAKLARLSTSDLDALTYAIGSLIEDQTKRRINSEKTAPGLKDMGKTARSLLVAENHLLTSIQNYTTGETARVGTNLIYGAIHQFGGEAVDMPIPARPYLGLSDENAREITDLVADTLEDLLQ
jgi:phage virion morphogenesis protein